MFEKIKTQFKFLFLNDFLGFSPSSLLLVFNRSHMRCDPSSTGVYWTFAIMIIFWQISRAPWHWSRYSSLWSCCTSPARVESAGCLKQHFHSRPMLGTGRTGDNRSCHCADLTPPPPLCAGLGRGAASSQRMKNSFCEALLVLSSPGKKAAVTWLLLLLKSMAEAYQYSWIFLFFFL